MNLVPLLWLLALLLDLWLGTVEHAYYGFWGAIILAIASLFVSVARIVMDVIRVLAPIFQAVWTGINFVIRTIGENAGRFFKWIVGALRDVYDGVIRPVIDAVVNGFKKVQQFLDRVFKPIREAFEWVNDALDWVWTKIIAPILDVIEKVRAVLRILAALGVPFAALLEKFLQVLETKIFETFREVRDFVNTIFNWFDILLDPRGWIRSTPFLMTIWQFGGNVVNLIAKLGGDPRHALAVDVFRAEHPLTPFEQIASDLRRGVHPARGAAELSVARLRSRRAGV